MALNLVSVSAFAAPKMEANFFEKKIQPILETHCFKCHSHQSSQLKGELYLDTRADLLKGGATGKAIIPGQAEKSLIIQAVSYEDLELKMPPKEKLSPSQVADLKQWINGGAPIPEKYGAQVQSADKSPKKHWAFQAIQQPAIPAVKNRRWVTTPLDAFILQNLEKQKLRPTPAADRATWLRRVTLDLTGLPPTPEEVLAFEKDRSAKAKERVVERLLASPRYGERWARHWLDLVRYAESNGYERDAGRTNAWRYRDYVIDSLNKDKPFDRFLTEQLAGDELENSNSETQIATTFLRLGTWDDEPADHLLDRYEQLDDVVGTSTAVFLGQTLRCARCHDHKFEPFSQKDYYRVLAIFDPLKRPQKEVSLTHRSEFELMTGTAEELAEYQKASELFREKRKSAEAPIRSILVPLLEKLHSEKKLTLSADSIEAYKAPEEKRTDMQRDVFLKTSSLIEAELVKHLPAENQKQISDYQKQLAAIDAQRPQEPPYGYIWFEDSHDTPQTRVLKRGQPSTPGESVEPSVPEVLQYASLEPPRPQKKSTGRRLWFAHYLTRGDHPLTSRVMVNRVWQWHFGDGLVSTENDFGVMGTEPKNQALLDWLAVEFVKSGWSLKQLHRQIVLSSTYGQSAWRSSEPPKGYLQGWMPRRLEAEAVRDSMLAISGQLNIKQGGPSVYPELPASVLATRDNPKAAWGTSPLSEQYRRSVYIFAKRSIAVPELDLMDAPSSTTSCEQRVVSTTGPQALTFLNGKFVQEQAGHFTERLLSADSKTNEAETIGQAILQVLGRPALSSEIKECSGFLRESAVLIQRESPTLNDQEVRKKAWKSLGVVLLNSNEFFYLN